MRKFIVWFIPVLTGFAEALIWNTPTPFWGRAGFLLLLSAASIEVFDMALHRYVIREIESVMWHVTVVDTDHIDEEVSSKPE